MACRRRDQSSALSSSSKPRTNNYSGRSHGSRNNWKRRDNVVQIPLPKPDQTPRSTMLNRRGRLRFYPTEPSTERRDLSGTGAADVGRARNPALGRTTLDDLRRKHNTPVHFDVQMGSSRRARAPPQYRQREIDRELLTGGLVTIASNADTSRRHGDHHRQPSRHARRPATGW